MKIIDYSIEDIIQISKNKKILCFGAGQVLKRFCNSL